MLLTNDERLNDMGRDMATVTIDNILLDSGGMPRYGIGEKENAFESQYPTNRGGVKKMAAADDASRTQEWTT